MGYRWKPNQAQRRAYHERMVAIEESKSTIQQDGYDLNCTGNCCIGDKIAFFNAGKSGDKLYGEIIRESYGEAKQQHTFTIKMEATGESLLIKGRNLYKNGVLRKVWEDESKRVTVLAEKHQRGDEARAAAKRRKQQREEEKLHSIPGWAMDQGGNQNS